MASFVQRIRESIAVGAALAFVLVPSHGLAQDGPSARPLVGTHSTASHFSPDITEGWPGFRGLLNQGYSAAEAPTLWSTNQNVLWSSTIPGQGHSSPIVSGDAIFVTTAYPSPRYETRRRLLTYTSWGLAGFLLLASFLETRHRRSSRGDGTEAASVSRRTRAIILFTNWAVLALLAAAVVFGPARLTLEENDNRAWKFSVAIALAYLIFGSLQYPARSRWRLTSGLLTLLLGVAAYALVPDKRDLWDFRSLSAIGMLGIVLLPILLGFACIAVQIWTSRRPLQRDQYISAPSPTGVLVWGASLLLAATFFVHFSYVRRVKELARAVLCFDLKDGRQRWVCEGLRGIQKPLNSINSPATPTPVTDGERILAYFGSSGLMCVSRDGHLLWVNRALPSEGRFGNATSPILANGLAIVVSDIHEPKHGDLQKVSYIAALDLHTGKIVWRTIRKNHQTFAGYNTPLLASSSPTNVVWVRGWHDLKGYDPANGHELFSFDTPFKGNHLIVSPVWFDQKCLLADADTYTCLDLKRLNTDHSPVLWTGKSRGEIGSTPLVVSNLVFLVSEDGQAECLDALTGKIQWRKRLKGRYFASVLGGGGKVYFCNDTGRTFVTAASSDFRLLAENNLGARTYASFAPIGDRLLIRTEDRLYCIQEAK